MASSGTPTSTRWPTRCAGDGWAKLCAAAPSADREQRRQEAAPTHFLPVPFWRPFLGVSLGQALSLGKGERPSRSLRVKENRSNQEIGFEKEQIGSVLQGPGVAGLFQTALHLV